MGDKDRGSAALAGAAGVVAAEVVAEAITDNAIKNIHAEAKAEGKVLTEAEFQEKFSSTLEMTTDWGRLGAAVTALVTDLDANIATATAANAVNNNLIPMLIAVGYVAYVAYDVYDTYQEKGLDAAVLKLGFEVGMVASGTVAGAAAVKVYQLIKTVPKIVKGVVVGVERIVEITAPNAKIAWAMYMEAHPGIAMVMNKLMGKVTAGIDKVAAGVDKVAAKVSPHINKAADNVAAGVERFKKFDDRLDAAVLGSLAKGAEKLGFSIQLKQAAKVVATDAAEQSAQKSLLEEYQHLMGEYKTIRGHHVHAKKAFEGHVNYDPKKGFSISNELMKNLGIDHTKVTQSQRKLFTDLATSGRLNTLQEHTRIAVEALMQGGCQSEEVARSIVARSLWELKKANVRTPTNIPWNSSNN
jgi:hypothetical protein